MAKGSMIIDSAPTNPNVTDTNLPTTSEPVAQNTPPKVHNNA